MAPVKGSNPRSIPEDKVQFNFNANEKALSKLKVIAVNEKVSTSDLLNMAMDRFIDTYEKKNGKVKATNKEKGEGLKGL